MIETLIPRIPFTALDCRSQSYGPLREQGFWKRASPRCAPGSRSGISCTSSAGPSVLTVNTSNYPVFTFPPTWGVRNTSPAIKRAMEEATINQYRGGPNPLDSTRLFLLSLNGGGVRGLSTLYIMKSIMDRLNHERKTSGNLLPVKPCQPGLWPHQGYLYWRVNNTSRYSKAEEYMLANLRHNSFIASSGVFF
jgi:hypothetical protein